VRVEGLLLGSSTRRLGDGTLVGRHRGPRGTEGTLPGRISIVWNVTTPTGSR